MLFVLFWVWFHTYIGSFIFSLKSQIIITGQTTFSLSNCSDIFGFCVALTLPLATWHLPLCHCSCSIVTSSFIVQFHSNRIFCEASLPQVIWLRRCAFFGCPGCIFSTVGFTEIRNIPCQKIAEDRILRCSVFQPDFGCCAHLKACQNTNQPKKDDFEVTPSGSQPAFACRPALRSRKNGKTHFFCSFSDVFQ